MIFYEEPNDAGGAGGITLLAAAPSVVSPAAVATNGHTGPAWIKEDGTFNDNWMETALPENLRGDASLRVMPSFTDLAKSYVETKRLVGTKLEMPGEGATPEALANWRKTVGAPDKPEGYLGEAKTIRPDSIPPEMWDAAAEKGFLEIAHEHSLPPAALKAIMGYYGKHIAASLEAAKGTESTILAEEGAKLKTAWGQEHDANLTLAARVAQTVGLDPKTHPIFTNADAVQAFAKMGKLLSEDKLVRGDAGASIGTTITGRIQDIQDPQAQTQISREYRGEFGQERQAAAQKILHDLMIAQTNANHT